MNYGFVIDNRKCIGCHACTTACKSENDVPVGVNRTWVKYVETGGYPDVTRHFQVTRCNHCANPPCVRICPVTAMYQRKDGIVEFDQDACIGCKACMQACPYDAIYIDPETDAAAKCHFCAHRVEVGLEPACVVVCPEHAIISGDMDDPNSEISRTLAGNKTTVRKPEQGTKPKLYYIDGVDVSLRPTATADAEPAFMFADVVIHHGSSSHDDYSQAPHQPLGSTDNPVKVGGRMAGQMVQVAYNAQHKVPWHWPVAAYLVTKAIAAGIIVLLGLFWGLNLVAFDPMTAVAGGFASLVFVGITTALLVWDLEKPELFLTILTRPNWNSWLARGAFILVGFSLLLTVWWALESMAWLDWISVSPVARAILLWPLSVLAVGSAVYTAYLFGQAEGRDLWQSTLLPFHLLVQAVMAGSAMLLIMGTFLEFGNAMMAAATMAFVATLVTDLFVTLAGEFGMRHASEVAARAAHAISHGKYRNHFWWGSIVMGHLLPLVFGVLALSMEGVELVAAIGAVAAITGLYLFEYAFVMAPQEIPNS